MAAGSAARAPATVTSPTAARARTPESLFIGLPFPTFELSPHATLRRPNGFGLLEPADISAQISRKKRVGCGCANSVLLVEPSDLQANRVYAPYAVRARLFGPNRAGREPVGWCSPADARSDPAALTAVATLARLFCARGLESRRA